MAANGEKVPLYAANRLVTIMIVWVIGTVGGLEAEGDGR